MAGLGLSEKQLAERRLGVGSSEVAKVVGLVPGAIDVWASKMHEVADLEPLASSDLMEFGQRIEEVIGDAYVARHREIRIYKPGTIWHPTADFACATPDRVVAPPGIGRPARDAWLRLLEIKTSFFSSHEYGEAADEIPEQHLVQVAWQMECCDIDECVLVALLNGRYREYAIPRDRELGRMLLDQVGRWWRDHVGAGVPPPVDGSEAYGAYLRRRYPADLAPPLDPTPELEQLVAKVRGARAALKAAEETEAAAANALRAVLGDAAGATGLCTFRANKPSTKTDLAAALVQFRNDLDLALSLEPEARLRVLELLEQAVSAFTTTKPGARVLRLSKET